MSYDPDRHDRRSIRLPDYDYRQPGGYFVTICTKDRVCLFGGVTKGRMYLNKRGRVAAEEWHHTAEVRQDVELDAFVVMPNHLRGIIVITRSRGTACRAPTRKFGGPVSGSLSTIVRSYKSAVTRRINRLWEPSGETIWQRGFFEHIIRGRRDPERIRRYIEVNPAGGIGIGIMLPVKSFCSSLLSFVHSSTLPFIPARANPRMPC